MSDPSDDYPFEIEFYEENGVEPVLSWMRSDLTASERRTLGLAMLHYLQKEGIALARNKRLCEPVGDGVFEFKLRYNLKELTKRLNLPYKPTGAGDTEDVMLRVFFHQHEGAIILLLHGYDKGANPNARHQQAQIRIAKDRLKKWLGRESKAAKAAAKKAPAPASPKIRKKRKR